MKFCSNNQFAEDKVFSKLPDLIEQKMKPSKTLFEKLEKFLLDYSIYDFSIMFQFQHIIDALLKLFEVKTLSSFTSKQKILVTKPRENHILKVSLIQIYNSVFSVICKSISHHSRLSKTVISPFCYEYNISTFTTNYLRQLSPHFGYTLGNVQSGKNNVSIIQEYIKGDTLAKYLQKNIHKANNDTLSSQFLSIFTQTITALEVAQQSLQFTHHDFHHDNLIIRKISKENPLLSIKVFDNYYHFENIGLCPTIIDFESSTTRYKKDCVFINAYTDLLKYGYIGIFVPGIDVVRFLFTIYSQVLISEAKKEFHSFGFKIFNFVEYIFEHFFHIKSPILDKQAFRYHSSYFFNTTHFPQIFLTPNELLLFLEKHKTKICKIFDRQSYPWTVQRMTFPTTFIHSEKYNKKKQSAFCQVLCLNSFYPSENSILYDFMNKDIIKLSEKDFITLLDKILQDYEYPSLYPEHIVYLQKFYEDNNFIIPTYEFYFTHYFIYQDGIGRFIFESENAALYTRLYRTLSSIYSLLLLQSKNKNVLSEMKKFDREKVTYIPKTLQKNKE